jgi:hypothetical protein
MREDEFRRRLQGALGEPPPLAPPALRAPAVQPARLYPRAMGLLAVAVAVLLIVVLVGSRIALQPRGYVMPASSPSALAVLPPDSMPCHLAVQLVQDAGNPGSTSAMAVTMGFINIPAGAFEADPGARVSDLPSGSVGTQSVYSAALGRWLPASIQSVSPDGRSYAYVKQVQAGSELHVVDAAHKADRRLWISRDGIDVINWSASGILVSTLPHGGGVMLFWYIDPSTGTGTQAPDSVDPRRMSLGLLPSGSWASYGTDSSGTTVFRSGARGGSDPEKVYVVQSGKATLIYSGTAGDAADFDPETSFTDAHGVWIGNYDGRFVWLWSESAGLRNFKTSGGPPPPSGYQFTSAAFLPAGPCVPGVFHGKAASPLPAATSPSPSPPAPVVDWAPLLAKPLQLPSVVDGCPVSPQKNLQVTTTSGKGGPNYGYGQGPVYLSGQTNWYSGTQGVVILTDPRYAGPVLVRAKRLDGSGSITFMGNNGIVFKDGGLGIPQTSAPPRWGAYFGTMSPSAPGCYGIQFDGTSFSEYAVIEVKQGPPPPG